MRCLPFLLLFALAARPRAETLLQSSFDDSELPDSFETAAGSWIVDGGALHARPVEGEKEGALWVTGDLGHVAVEVSVRFVRATDPGRWVGLVVREAAEEHGFQLSVRQAMSRQNGLEIAQRGAGAGGGWAVYQTAAGRTDAGDGFHRLRFEIAGDHVRAYVDGECVLRSARGGEAPASGRVGLVVNQAHVVFDDLIVTRVAARPFEPATATPTIIAHRGSSARAPENTLVAYREAIADGATWAECDVYVTADRVPILLHDKTLRRTTGDGRKPGAVELAEIRTLDAGSWKHERYAGEPIPTLAEALELVRGKLHLCVEIKDQGIEEETVQCLRELGVTPEQATFFCFDSGVVERCKELAPEIPGTWLIGSLPFHVEGRLSSLAHAASIGADNIGLPWRRVDPQIVDLAHAAGFGVYVWTVNDAATMRYLQALGVDAIITDVPREALAVIGESERDR